jgi:hypothetical protein
MAKSDIRWNGAIQGGGDTNQSIPASTSLVWGDNSYTWGDVQFISDIADGIGTGSRRARQEILTKITKDEKKRKKLVHLICRIKGEKVYDEKKETEDMKITIEDVDMVINEILGKIKVETKDVL